MRYLFAVLDDRTNSATAGEKDAINAFNDRLESGGHRILAAGLVAPPDGSVVDNRSGLGSVERGPASDTTPYMAGFWVIEAPSDAEAMTLALDASAACNRRIEVRRFL